MRIKSIETATSLRSSPSLPIHETFREITDMPNLIDMSIKALRPWKVGPKLDEFVNVMDNNGK